MALLWMDSFDHYATADITDKYPAFPTQCTIKVGGGRRSTNSLHTGYQYAARVNMSPADATVVVGFAIKTGQVDSNSNIVHIYKGGTRQLTLWLSDNNSVLVYRGYSSQLLGSSAPGVFPVNAWIYVEMKALIHPTAGAVIVRINEAEVLTIPVANTSASGTADYDGIDIQGTTSQNPGTDFDDFYILDGSGPPPRNDFLGDCRVDVRFPTAMGASHEWTPSSGGDNRLMVADTAPDGDATYNSTLTIGAKDTYVVQDAPVPGAGLLGVQLVLNGRKTDAGSCSVAPVCNGVVAAPGNPGVDYLYYVRQYGTNPVTGLSWTEAEFNAAEFGYKRTA